MHDKPLGVISRDEAYSKLVVMQRLGVSQKVWDRMLDEGLPFIPVGHTRWVTGQDLIQHLRKNSQTKLAEAQ